MAVLVQDTVIYDSRDLLRADIGQPIYHIPPKFYTPFTVGNSQIERMAAAEGEFGFYALDAYLGASIAVRGGFSAARQELSMARRLGNCFVAGPL